MATWDEIKRLAADFQRAQLISTQLKLSERNCIEIVQRLIELKLLDIIYTSDGKEYLTPIELEKQIKEELVAQGGRINLVDLQQILGVDFSRIEIKAHDIVKSDRSVSLVLGQLIDRTYIDSIAEEINDKLQEQGQVTIGEITKLYDLPREFLVGNIERRLGKTIKGERDDANQDVIYTQSFVERHKAKITGAFSTITKPVQISSVIQQFALQERLLFTVLEQLIKSGRLLGSLTGGTQEMAEYIPDIYTRSQNEWAGNFFKQNGYLEYDSLRRLGINDPKTFIKTRLKETSDILFLETCCVGKHIEEQIEVNIDENLATVGWIDVMPELPSILNSGDSQQILQRVLKARRDATIFGDYIVASNSFIEKCCQPFDKLMQVKAEKDVKANPSLLSKTAKTVQDDRKGKDKGKEKARSSGKSCSSMGGTQGREVKTKATKKKYMKGKNQQDDDSDNEAHSSDKMDTVPFLTPEEIEEQLTKFEAMKDCPDELINELAAQIARPLQKQYQEVVKSVFLQSLGGGVTTSARKKTHTDLSERINGLWINAKLFEKAIKCFPEESNSTLIKHLLKTVCTDIINVVLNAVAADHMLSVNDDSTITPEIRNRIITKIPEGKQKAVLTKLNIALQSKELTDFFNELDKACDSKMIDVMLKKPDKKKERQLVFNHKMALVEQLKQESDPAMVLHLAVTLLFNVFTQCIVHAPGRCVPSILLLIKPHLQEDSYKTLVTFQDLVIQQLKQEEDTKEDDVKNINSELNELLTPVKDIALNTRKSVVSENQE